MKTSELKRKVSKLGCYCLREGTNHEIWYNPNTGGLAEIGRHSSQEVKPKTLRKIMKGLFGQ